MWLSERAAGDILRLPDISRHQQVPHFGSMCNFAFCSLFSSTSLYCIKDVLFMRKVGRKKNQRGCSKLRRIISVTVKLYAMTPVKK